ncbi:hypothetical protein LEN26_012737 [Aphanomyces euteiches]|nr:hypothetical protein LEN26_012737 [Aphanomyces euteiches]KAH9122494.1 hypothetical protein AeMF1_006230 [Aphanomyces euteiches]KAH9181891.1 hypothetical protein AeNC1_016134 [Aphanomyces euteiches]
MDECLAEILELREEESRRSSSKKLALKSKDQLDQDIGAAIREEAMKAMGERKKKDTAKNFSCDLTSVMAQRGCNDNQLEMARLELEEWRIQIEEKRAAYDEQRFELEKQERLALLNLISKLSDNLA